MGRTISRWNKHVNCDPQNLLQLVQFGNRERNMISRTKEIHLHYLQNICLRIREMYTDRVTVQLRPTEPALVGPI